MNDNPFKDTSDEELVAIINDPFCKSSNQPQAAVELHRRKKQQGRKNFCITIITVIIAAITLIVVLLQFCQSLIRIPSDCKQSNYSHPSKQLNQQINDINQSKTLESLKKIGK